MNFSNIFDSQSSKEIDGKTVTNTKSVDQKEDEAITKNSNKRSIIDVDCEDSSFVDVDCEDTELNLMNFVMSFNGFF